MARNLAVKQILIDVPLSDAGLARLRALPGASVQVVEPHKVRSEWSAEWLRGCHVLLCKFPPSNFDDLTSLEYMQLSTVGYEHLRDLGLGERKVQTCNARGLFDTAIGEWNIAMMVNLLRDLRGMIHNQEHGAWDRATRFHQEVRGRTVGLWGYGGIGRETARVAKAFGLTVHVMARKAIGPRRDAYTLPGTGDPDGVLPDSVFTMGQERKFLGGLDFLILALPHTKQSNGMVGAEELRALPKTAFVLNPRGGRSFRNKRC
jgi:phosphoglycerate dehydrogenase-like enzyme